MSAHTNKITLFPLLNILIFCAVTILSWYSLIYVADTLPPFYSDETSNIQSAVKLFTTGKYYNERVFFTFSSGPAVTWPGAIGWFLGGNMLSSRIACSFVSWILVLAVGYLFFKKYGFSSLTSLTITNCLWATQITTPFAFPYWFGFMQALGELNTLVIIAFGMFLLQKKPLAGVFIFGIAFWLGKYIYLPFIALVLIGDLLAKNTPWKDFPLIFAKYLAVFILPELFWLIFNAFAASPSEAWKGLMAQADWLHEAKAVHSYELPTIDTLISRLNASEWSRYSLGTKGKVILFSLGSMLLSIICYIAAFKKKITLNKREFWLSLMTVLTIGIFVFYYFAILETMWVRHIQPGLYLGYGLVIFWVMKGLGAARRIKLFMYIPAAILIIFMTIKVIDHPLLAPKSTYARSCTNLYTDSCDKLLYDSEGNILYLKNK